MYMSPEVYEKKIDVKSDVWSLGVTLMTLAIGKNPYEGPNVFWVCVWE